MPFDIELAKKIQSGEVEGRIILNKTECAVRIICFDRIFEVPIIALIIPKGCREERITYFYKNGNGFGCGDSLLIELPEETPKSLYNKEQCIYGKDSKMICEFCSALCRERAEDFAKRKIKVSTMGEEETPKHEFKPFDKVLVYNRLNGKWFPNLFSHIASDGRIVTITNGFYENYEVIPYEGNEHLVGTTNNFPILNKL